MEPWARGLPAPLWAVCRGTHILTHPSPVQGRYELFWGQDKGKWGETGWAVSHAASYALLWFWKTLLAMGWLLLWVTKRMAWVRDLKDQLGTSSGCPGHHSTWPWAPPGAGWTAVLGAGSATGLEHVNLSASALHGGRSARLSPCELKGGVIHSSQRDHYGKWVIMSSFGVAHNIMKGNTCKSNDLGGV